MQEDGKETTVVPPCGTSASSQLAPRRAPGRLCHAWAVALCEQRLLLSTAGCFWPLWWKQSGCTLLHVYEIRLNNTFKSFTGGKKSQYLLAPQRSSLNLLRQTRQNSRSCSIKSRAVTDYIDYTLHSQPKLSQASVPLCNLLHFSSKKLPV